MDEWTPIMLVLAVYCLPTIIAIIRGMERGGGLLLLNLFLGWTVLGWLGALIWSVTGETSRDAKRRRKAHKAQIAMADAGTKAGATEDRPGVAAELAQLEEARRGGGLTNEEARAERRRIRRKYGLPEEPETQSVQVP